MLLAITGANSRWVSFEILRRHHAGDRGASGDGVAVHDGRVHQPHGLERPAHDVLGFRRRDVRVGHLRPEHSLHQLVVHGADRQAVGGEIRRPGADAGERAQHRARLRRQLDHDQPVALVVEIAPADVIAVLVVEAPEDGAGVGRIGVAGVDPVEPFLLCAGAVVDHAPGDDLVVLAHLLAVPVELLALRAGAVDQALGRGEAQPDLREARARPDVAHRAERKHLALHEAWGSRVEGVDGVIREADLRDRLVAVLAGAAEGLDVADLDRPAHVLGREAARVQQVERQLFVCAIGRAREHLEKGRDGTDLVAVAEADGLGGPRIRDLAARVIDVKRLGRDDAPEVEAAVGHLELVIVERRGRGAQPRDGERRQDDQLDDAHRTLPMLRGCRGAAGPVCRIVSISTMVSRSARCNDSA